MTDNICFHVAEVHASVGAQSEQYFVVEKRYNYVTPTSFLELISFYKSLLAERRQEMSNQIERLATGLQTLKNTNKDVTALKEDLKIKMVDVNKKKAECDVFLCDLGVPSCRDASTPSTRFVAMRRGRGCFFVRI